MNQDLFPSTVGKAEESALGVVETSIGLKRPGIPNSDSRHTTQVVQRSYIVNVSRVETSPSQDRPGGVLIAPRDITAGVARKGSVAEFESGRGSCAALAAIHRRVSGGNDNDCSSRRRRDCKQNLFGCTYRAIRRLLGHLGLGEKLRVEIFNGNTPEVGHDLACPLESAIFPLACNRQVYTRDLQLGREVSLRVTFRAGQFALRLLQRLRVCFSLIAARQIELVSGGRCDTRYTPVNADGIIGWRKFFILPTGDEGNVPVAFAVSTDVFLRAIGKWDSA